jgi:hypothetical protein
MTEPSTKVVETLAENDPSMIVWWWAAEVKCASTIARFERDDALDDAAATQVFHRLRQLAHAWHEVDPSDPVREAAVRFLREHPIRAADALALAAAFIAAERRPSSLEGVNPRRSSGHRCAKRRIWRERRASGRRVAVGSFSGLCRSPNLRARINAAAFGPTRWRGGRYA